jgi:hypothetical protein
MTISSAQIIGSGIRKSTDPATAVRKFARGSVEYAAFANDQVLIRIPILDQVAIKASEEIGVYATFRSGSTATNLVDKERYASMVRGIKSGTIDNKAYHDYQQELMINHTDADYMVIIPSQGVPEGEHRNLRNDFKKKFEDRMQSEAFVNLNKCLFRVDLHYGSTIVDSKFKILDNESKGKPFGEEYDGYIKSLDKITGSVIDERENKGKRPLPLYYKDAEITSIIEGKLAKGSLQSRDEWMKAWEAAMDFSKEAFQEDHTEECMKAVEEMDRKLYYGVRFDDMSTSFKQKMGLA